MSRTVALFTPSNTRAGTPYSALNPHTIRQAVNVGRQAASIVRTTYNGLHRLLASPRISAGAIRQVQTSSNQNMPRFSRARNNYRRRNARPRMSRRRRRYRRRARQPQQLQRIIKRKSRGIKNLMRLCKSDNPNYVYDYASVGTLNASFDATKHSRFTASVDDFERLKYYMTISNTTASAIAFSKEYKCLKVWVKAIPKRAHLYASGPNTQIAEVRDDQIRALAIWPLKHQRAKDETLAGVTKKTLTTQAGIKYVKFEKRSGTIMQHAPLVEVTQNINGSSSVNTYVPLHSFPWLEYQAQAERQKIQVATFDCQLPQFYTSVTPTSGDTRELPKYEFEVHAIFKVRTHANNLMES